MEQQSHQPSQHQPARYTRAYTYMKKPEFLLLLGLVNLLLILCVATRMHKIMYFSKMGYGMGYGQQNMYMMKKGHDMMRGYQHDYRSSRGGKMMNQMPQQNAQDLPMNQPTPPEQAQATQQDVAPTQ